MPADEKGRWKVEIGSDTLVDYTDVCKREPNNGGLLWQDVDGFRAESQIHFARGNRRIKRVFTLTREHESNAAAVAWFEIDALVFERVDDVVITHKDYTGAETACEIAGAKIEITVDEPIGVATTTHITITGGAAVLQP